MRGDSNILVVGLACNVAKQLPHEISRISGVLETFYSKVDFHVVESDSIDNTASVLHSISKSNPNLTFDSLGQLQPKFPQRIQRLRYCRNQYVLAYRNKLSEVKGGYAEVMVVDFDIKNSQFSKFAFKSVRDLNINWDALFANQLGRYYDIYALRAEGWSIEDCFFQMRNLIALGVSKEAAKQQAIWDKMIRVKQKGNPIPVSSAFGGMAIYRSWVFDRFDYGITSSLFAEGESEHVALNNKIEAAGGNLYIVPTFTNFSWNSHSLASFKFLRKLDSWTKHQTLKNIRTFARSRLG